MIYLNNTFCKKYSDVKKEETEKLSNIKNTLEAKQEMLDWLDIETTIQERDLERIEELSNEIKSNCDIFLVIGIGGSYLGSKAVIDALSPYLNKSNPEIIFIGNNLSSTYLEEVLEYIKGKRVYVNVISKSGNTLEAKLVFNIIYNYLKETDSNYQNKIIVTTSKNSGSLIELAKKENFRTLYIPDNIGGRFSVLTTVGLFPIRVAGININELIRGARSVRNCFDAASKLAITRYHLELFGKKVEAITYYEKKLSSFAMWYQQLFAETQGKEEKGILPFPNPNTTNLHSLGQYLQEGTKQVFETVIKISNGNEDKKFLPSVNNYPFESLNNIILEEVAKAHFEGDTPSIIISIDKLDEYNLGQLIYFLQMTSAIGAYLLDVNPFNQPGVEKYKANIRVKLEI